ncbi:FAD-binding protein, partial [Cobetia marina]
PCRQSAGATEGASRVGGCGFMPRARQVGATGTWVTARVYVAVGISGAIQHLQGIQRCDKVVAINLDGGCDMVKRADLSVIGDAGAILASLCQRSRPNAVPVVTPRRQVVPRRRVSRLLRPPCPPTRPPARHPPRLPPTRPELAPATGERRRT